MRKNLLTFSFFTLMALFLCVQGGFLLYPEGFGEREAERFHSLFITAGEKLRSAEEHMAGLTVYLTVETADGTGSPAEITVNGVSVGDLRKGVLMFRGGEGDVIGLRNGENRKYLLSETNGFVDKVLLPGSVTAGAGDTVWGKVHFR